MPATITEVNYASIKITSDVSIPAILVKITGRATTGEELFALAQDQVYPWVQNCVAPFAFYYNWLYGPYPDMLNTAICDEYVSQINSWPGGTDTIGSDSGFKLVRTGVVNEARVYPGPPPLDVQVVGTFSIRLYYKGDLVFSSYPATGYGNPEILPLILYQDDESGELITFPPTSGNTGLYLSGVNDWYSASAGDGTLPVIIIPPDLNCVSVGYPAGEAMAGETEDVEDDIENVRPASADPYEGAGDSGPGGVPGSFDYGGNPPGGIESYTDPTLSATDAGFITLFNPSTAELKALASYLWSNSFDINTFKKLFNDPMDLFLGLSILPVPIPNGARVSVGIGLIDTGVVMTKAASQWARLDCGYVTIPRYSGSYLDFDPYTSVEIYLPFIGSRTLKADEVVGHTLHVTYNVDILSGACAAWIDSDGVNMYVFMGQCASSIPVASGDWTNMINGILSVVGGAAGGAIKGGVGGAIAGGVAAASAVAVTDGKISVERSGAVSSAGGFRAPKKPYIVVSTPRLCKPGSQNTFEGYPAYFTSKIGDMRGFTQVELTNLSNIPATGDELSEIKQLLLTGVIL